MQINFFEKHNKIQEKYKIKEIIIVQKEKYIILK